jgi:hypothetical protein
MQLSRMNELATSDTFNQLLAQGRRFFSGTPASSTNKTGRHDIAEILLKVALNTKIHSFLIIAPQLPRGGGGCDSINRFNPSTNVKVFYVLNDLR